MQQTHGCPHFSSSLPVIFPTLESFQSPQISPAKKQRLSLRIWCKTSVSFLLSSRHKSNLRAKQRFSLKTCFSYLLLSLPPSSFSAPGPQPHHGHAETGVSSAAELRRLKAAAWARLFKPPGRPTSKQLCPTFTAPDAKATVSW